MKLMLNDKEVEPMKKVKLYREIPSANVKLIMENKEELKKLKEKLKSEKNK